MPIKSAQIFYDGTGYTVEMQGVAVNEVTETMGITIRSGERTNNQAIVEQALWELEADGEFVAEVASGFDGFSPVSGFVETLGIFEVDIEPSLDPVTFDLTVFAPDPVATGLDRDDVASHTFTFTLDPSDLPNPTPPDVIVNCDVDPTEPMVGETVSVTATAVNNDDVPGNVEIDATFGSASDSETLFVPANDDRSAVFNFEPEETGVIEPELDVTVLPA